MTRTDLLGRTVAEVAAKARWFLLAEGTTERNGFLQAVTPSVTLVGLLVLVGLAATRRTPHEAAALAAVAASLAVASRVPARAFLGRTVGPPALAFVVVAPQAVLMEGATLAGPVTVPGAAYVLTFVVRVGACVGFLALLLATTRFSDVLGALAWLRVPHIAVTLVAITYRYLLVFFAELGRMARARRSRTIREPTLRRAWRDSGSFLGTFFLRSIERGERVQRAARARGGGDVRGYDRRERPGVADAAFALVVALVGIGVVVA